MAVSKAHIKASNKYNKENYKKIQANVKPDDYSLMTTTAKITRSARQNSLLKPANTTLIIMIIKIGA